jgi:hypothetical protein
MPAILDVGSQLIGAGQVSSTQDFPALQVQPRFLPTCHWVVSMLIPPAAAATFTLSVSTTQNGTYSPIATLVWPAATTGSKQVPLGVQGNMAQFRNNQAAWLRASVTLSGPLTLVGSWLTTSTDGGPGLGSRSYHLDQINAL